MAVYYFKAVNSQGKKSKGTIEAYSEREVREYIRSQGLLLVDIKIKTLFLNNDCFSKEALLGFTLQLAQLLEAGIPLYESLLALEEHSRGEKGHGIILRLATMVKEGKSLSQALSLFPRTFDKLYISMIKAGEATGALGAICLRLHTLLERQIKLKKQLGTALLYPLILALFSFAVMGVLLLFVVPSIEALFEGREVNGLTRWVLYFSRFFSGYWPALFVGLVAVLSWAIWYLKTPGGKLKIYQIFMNVPLINTIMVQASLSRLSRTMFTLLKGGINIVDSLRTARQVMKNPILEKVIEACEAKIIEGGRLSRELKQFPIIPKMLPRMIAIGEEGGDLTLMFQKIAEIYEGDLEKTLTRLTALAQPIILIGMGLVVGVVMLSVLLPLTDASAFISH